MTDAYARPQVARDYAVRSTLTRAEIAALGEAGPCVRRDVLDIGVGGGRTTAYLLGMARSYRALDLSTAMVDACRTRYPGIAVEIGDARTLAGHGGESYDLVLFSFNGIDDVGYADRSRVFASVRRVLRPGGTFVYSSHNLRSLGGRFPPLSMQRIVPSINPARLAVRTLRAAAASLRGLRNRRRLAPAQRLGEGYAIVNNEDYDYSMLTVYVDPQHECATLAAAGFTQVTTFDLQGRRNPETPDDPWVYYVARKAPPPALVRKAAR